MHLSERTINLLKLMPRAAAVVDIQTTELVYQNSVCKALFSIADQGCSQALTDIMVPAPPAQSIRAALHQELQVKGKGILRHVSMQVASNQLEHYDIHVSYTDERREAVYLIFVLSDHELQRMAEQNAYYDTLTGVAYSYPFRLDAKARRAEFFDPEMERNYHMPTVMENFPDSVLQYNYICEDDIDVYVKSVERMYQGLPPEGSYRFYDPKGELLRYTVNYVVNRDESGAPIQVVGDYILQPEPRVALEESATGGGEQVQKIVLAHQIKAHFFFNTLNTISALCKQDAAKADTAISTFAIYMRTYMHLISESAMIPFDQELTLVKSTLEIEKLRFPENFTYEFEIEERDFEIPPLTLQPIVENALLHGLRRTGRHGSLKISTHRAEDTIYVTIADNGLGFDTRILEQSTSIGLKNLTQRIEIMAGGAVDIQSQPGQGTRAVISLPVATSQQEMPATDGRPKVIYVDDEPASILNFTHLMKNCDQVAAVETFSRPSEVLAHIQKNHVDIAFLDVDMPEMTGFLLAQRLQAIQPTIKIAFVTGNIAYMKRSNQIVEANYIFKPYDMEDIQSIL